jgi:citrate synthase
MDSTINYEEFVGARQAAEFLGIKLETLYAYTSRGWIRSRPSGSGRERLYMNEDLERLKVRREARSGHTALAAAALRWEEPVLDSSISTITALGPVYRGVPAVELARRGVSFEQVATLLWTGELPENTVEFSSRMPSLPHNHLQALISQQSTPMSVLSVLVPLLAHVGGAGVVVPTPNTIDWERARSLVKQLASYVGFPQSQEKTREALQAKSIADSVLISLHGTHTPEAVEAVNRALILCADHELNASAFAARVTASTGANLYACVTSALATLSGPQHGGLCDRVDVLLREISRAERTAAVLQERAEREESVPGFGHPLYPKGDPRAVLLLEDAHKLGSGQPLMKVIETILELMAESDRELPTLDLGLVALTAALKMPPGSASALFAVGRSVGWIAHIMEQRVAGYLLRPRARYTGPEIRTSLDSQ